MLTIELDSSDESVRSRLALRKCPSFRRWVLLGVAFITFVSGAVAFSYEAELETQLIRVVVVVVLVPFLAWALLVTPYLMTLGSSSEAFHVLSGKSKVFDYSFSNDGVKEISEGTENVYVYSEFIHAETSEPELYVVFRKGIIYLPRSSIKKGSSQEFLFELDKHVTSQGKRDAVTGACPWRITNSSCNW